MLDLFCLGVAMTVGQAGNPALVPPPEYPRPQLVQQVTPGYNAPTLVAQGKPVISVDPAPLTLPALRVAQPAQLPVDKKDVKDAPKVEEKKEEEKKEEEEKKDEPTTYFFMKMLDGTPLGKTLEDRRISISGWTQMSYTGSSADTVNLPVVWNDRANRFLLQQHWLTIQKSLDTESKCASYGWRLDAMFGSDYRFLLMRGLFNSQLLNSKPNANEPGGFEQNLYGFDLPQFYVNAYLPNLFEGTEIRAGRMYTPWGLESVEGVTTPLLSRSYAFNWSPPFFHMAVAVLPKFNKNWSGQFMVANGNDVFFDPSQELRFVGALTWKSDDENDSVTVATSIGRGKFNAGDPFNPATNGLQSEAAGRNNMNAFDLVYTHKFNDCFSYGLEAIYGYQTGVPTTNVVGAVSGAMIKTNANSGTAHWGSVAQYFTYKWSDKVSTIFRGEIFDDFEGQRTGYEGVYYAGTFGVQYKPKDWLWIRPEIRYDYNGDSTPFNFSPTTGAGTSHHVWTAAADLIIRW
ncbi:MAG: porin [Planctomycetes bacterium]|nr:porin [Planctomycetota bacterium]